MLSVSAVNQVFASLQVGIYSSHKLLKEVTFEIVHFLCLCFQMVMAMAIVLQVIAEDMAWTVVHMPEVRVEQ